MPIPYNNAQRSRYQQLAQTLVTERATFHAHWQELADFVMPRRLRFLTSDRNKGDKRNQKIIDETPLYALRTLQSGMHSGLTSPARPWFMLQTADPDLNRSLAVKAWLRETTARIRARFQQANLYNALPNIYGDMAQFGTAACGILDDSKDLFRAYTYPIGSYALGLDNRGLATTFYREYETTVRQLVQDFGVKSGYRDIDWSRISTRVKKAWDDGNYETAVEVCWLVKPNEDHDPRRLDAKYAMPWSSHHYEKGTTDSVDGFLRESGYRRFPILCPRWSVTSHEDTYGTDCPGMTALGGVKQLQSQQKKKGQAINKIVDPPLVAGSQLKGQKVSLLSADLTYDDPAQAHQALRPIHEIRLDISHLTADMAEVQARVRRAYFEDVFLMMANDDRATPPTAEEIRARKEEKLIVLGPVLERTTDELLDPLIDRVYDMLDDGGLLPEAPEELQGMRLRVEYTSILAQAQKLEDVPVQDRFLNSVVAVAQMWPQARHKVNPFAAVNAYQDMLNADPALLVSDEDAQAAADQEAQATAAAQQAAMAKDGAAALHSASQSSMEGDSALSRIAQAVGAAA